MTGIARATYFSASYKRVAVKSISVDGETLTMCRRHAAKDDLGVRIVLRRLTSSDG